MLHDDTLPFSSQPTTSPTPCFRIGKRNRKEGKRKEIKINQRKKEEKKKVKETKVNKKCNVTNNCKIQDKKLKRGTNEEELYHYN